MRLRERHAAKVDERHEELPPPEVGSDRPAVVPVTEAAPPTERRVVDRERVWSPSQLVPLAGGVVLIVFGLAAVIKGGFGGPIDRPFVDVFGFSHTPLLGLLELGAGVILLLVGLTPGARTAAMFFGALVAIGGGLILANLDWINAHLTTDTDFGWVLLIVGGAVVVLTAILPTARQRDLIYR